LWQRNLLGFAGAVVFIIVTTIALYNRAWEVFEPAEPAHGPPKFSLSNPPLLQCENDGNLLVRLPNGLVCFDFLDNNYYGWSDFLWANWRRMINPLPKSAGPQWFIAGSNWVSTTAGRVNEVRTWQDQTTYVFGHPDTVGIRSDGTLWVSDNSNPKVWTGDKLTRFGDETNWQQVARSWTTPSVLLLKKDGTLWRWGTNHFNGDKQPQRWPGLRIFVPYQIGTNSDWKIISTAGGYGFLAQRFDGTAWTVQVKKGGNDELITATNFDQLPLEKLSRAGDQFGASVRKDGTLWLWGELYGRGHGYTLQSGTETNWVSAAVTWGFGMVALKSDGTLWKWDRNDPFVPAVTFTAPLTRMSIHNDWVAIVGSGNGVVSLAADGSLWYWPDRRMYEWSQPLLRLPKQPRFLGNVFGQSN
jgi:alpha-tubulin suppressor-like RCC1 family protein